MIEADSFLRPAREAGFDFYSGVPCSFLTPIINRVIGDRELTYVAAASEGEAVAIAAGGWLAGRRTVVMCQNSGLENAINPLTSLNFPFRIPTMLIVTWRGGPGFADEPQHELMGPITPAVLDIIRVPHRLFPTSDNEIPGALEAADVEMRRTDLPFAFIMEKGSVRDDGIDAPPPRTPRPGKAGDFRDGAAPPARIPALERLVEELPVTAAVIATTGYCGRELFTIADRPQHFYQVGSMGCASAMALGVALKVRRPVVVLDGDGAALMKMGTIATIGAEAPENLIHVVLDNGIHDSTGGQATVSATVDFAQVARSCGYPQASSADSLEGFERAFQGALTGPGPHLLHMRILPGSMATLGRPTVKPPEVARRFQAFLAAQDP